MQRYLGIAAENVKSKTVNVANIHFLHGDH